MKIVNLPVISIDKAASMYLQAKSKGVLPVRTLMQDNWFVMHFLDPDGNSVILKTPLLSATATSHGEVEIDPEMLFAAVEMRSRDVGRADARDVAVRVKPDSMMVD